MAYSFEQNKQTLELQRFLRRMRDRTVPNLGGDPQHQHRREDRYNRAIPTLICPWENDEPVRDAVTFALTRDLADQGVGLVLHQPLRMEGVVLGYWFDPEDVTQPWFFRGEVCREVPLGGGFWSLGVELREYLNPLVPEKLQPLVPLAGRLHPPAAMPVLL